MVSGYIKEMAWLRFNGTFSNASITSLLHNRLNLKWNPSQSFAGRLEIRNRFYWGDDVRTLPWFKEGLDNSNQYGKLAATYLDWHSTVAHTSVERLWLEYKKAKLNIRAGRQRINWGIMNTWNPNDLFNTYNFLDFDYEERQGSDAVKGQYLISNLSNIELACAATRDHVITALKYFTNYRKYDVQAIVGYYEESFTAGLGWAGSIFDIGFKGEIQYYTIGVDSVIALNLGTEADYIFKNGWYCSAAVLYNDRGIAQTISDLSGISFQISPLSLMPAKWSAMLGTSKEVTPRLSGNLTVIYSPALNMLILFPAVKYNLKQNIDVDLVWQSFFAQQEHFEAYKHTGYLRVKYSF
jgi:hypothetical protein